MAVTNRENCVMIRWRPLGFAAIAIATGCLAACGSCGASDRKADPAAESDASQEAWGAHFDLPPGWTGGQNESGGYEFTDGDNALMVGHHAIAEARSLDDFFDERRRALAVEIGELADSARSERTLHGKRTIALSGRAAIDGGSVEVRLVVANLGANEGLSLIMVGDAANASRLDQAWHRVLDSLRLP